MELTREQTIEEHRKMWQWITEHYEKNSIYSLDLYTLKKEYFRRLGYNHFYICGCSFLCEYTRRFGVARCEKCPLDWGMTQDCMGNPESKGLYKQIKDYDDIGDFEKCAELAWQIAELPEKR